MGSKKRKVGTGPEFHAYFYSNYRYLFSSQLHGSRKALRNPIRHRAHIVRRIDLEREIVKGSHRTFIATYHIKAFSCSTSGLFSIAAVNSTKLLSAYRADVF